MSRRRSHISLLAAGFFLAAGLLTPAASSAENFDNAARLARADLDASLESLRETREAIDREKIPLLRETRQLESDLARLRRETRDAKRLAESGDRDLAELEREVAARREEWAYLQSLGQEFLRTLESETHVAALPLFAEATGATRRELAEEEHLLEEIGLVLRGLRELAGGHRFSGEAVTAGGDILAGDFLLAGPTALFSAGPEGPHGLAEERVGSVLPRLFETGRRDAEAIHRMVADGEGTLVTDVTLGRATRRSEERDSFWQQIQAGGVVMIPILLLAAAALLLSVIKWCQIAGMRTATPEALRGILAALAEGRRKEAVEQSRKIKGPVGELLEAAIAHAGEKKELLEEILHEKILSAQPGLERFLPFIALAAATAPLLGLLGTVTGMINTFQLITLFGTGDARTLSGGISEALITTKFGLAVAIPALLAHALLARKAKGVLSDMEQTGVAFLNGRPDPERRHD